MIINLLKEKKNFITCSDIIDRNSDLLTQNTIKETIYWKPTFENSQLEWIKINGVHSFILKDIKFKFNGNFQKYEYYYSLDNFTWHKFYENSFIPIEELNFNIETIFIKIVFYDIQSNFELIDLDIIIDDKNELTINNLNLFCSQFIFQLLPNKIIEEDNLNYHFIKEYFKMLEDNAYINENKYIIKNGYFLLIIFNDLTYGSGGINSYAINTYGVGEK